MSHAAMRRACSRLCSVSFRAESGLPASASACRQRIKSIVRLLRFVPVELTLPGGGVLSRNALVWEARHLSQETNDGQGRRNLQNHGSDRNERNFVGGRREAGGPRCNPTP